MSSNDELPDELEIKPPQAQAQPSRERRRDRERGRQNRSLKEHHHRSADDERSRRRGLQQQQHQQVMERPRYREDERLQMEKRSHPRHSGSSMSRSKHRYGHNQGGGQPNPNRFENKVEESRKDNREDRARLLMESKQKRKLAEQEQERVLREIEKRRERERRNEGKGKVDPRNLSGSGKRSPSPYKSDNEDNQPSASKNSDALKKIKEIGLIPIEVEDIDESSSDLEEGEDRSASQSNSDISDADDIDDSKNKITSDISPQTSSHSDKSKASDSGESSISSDSDRESPVKEKHSEDSGSGRKPAKLARRDSSESDVDTDKEVEEEQKPSSDIELTENNSTNRTTKGNSESAEVEDANDELNQLPVYYPALQGCRRVEEFQLLNRIEEGTYGVVYRAKDKRTNEIVALKRLKMEKEKDGFPITSLREINTLLKAQHENIVTVREIVVGSNTDKIFLVMDYVEHDLKSLMETLKQKEQAFIMGEVKCLMIQLLRAVAHLHDNWILHRDLKTSNLLLSHKGILKVGDFGLAREYGSPLKQYTPIVVTLWYRAPELLLGIKEYSTPIDVWSVGCIFGELLKMEPMFPGKSEANQLNLIFQTLGTPNDRIWPGYTQMPLLQKMTFADYPVNKLRSKFSLLTELGIEMLNRFLTFNPQKRITAEEALKHPFFNEAPLPIDPSVFPTWPAKSEMGHRKAAASPKPPSGGQKFKDLRDDDGDPTGFFLGVGDRRPPIGAGFSLKF